MDKAANNLNINDEEEASSKDQPGQRERYPDSGAQFFLLHNAIVDSHNYSTNYYSRPGMSRYNHAMKNLIPIRRNNNNEEEALFENIGLFSYVYTTWLTRYLWKAYKKGVSLKDAPRISSYDTASYNSQRLELLWNEELSRHGPSDASFQAVVWKFVRTRIFISCILLTLSVTIGFFSASIFMRKLLEYIESPDGTIWDGAKWVILLTTCDFLRSSFFAWTWVTNYRTAVRVKAACTDLLYKKLIRLHSLGNKSTGELINLISNDSQRLFDTVTYGPMIISGPIATVLGVIYILWLFNPIALLGMIVFLLFYPCQYLISRATGYIRSKTVKITDARVRLVTEILESIKLIKTYAWEKYFSDNLLDIRRKEQRWLHKTLYFQSLSLSLTPAVPIISSIVTFLAYLYAGNNLTASQAFPISIIFKSLLSVVLLWLKECLRLFFTAIITFKRYKNILLLDEVYCHISKPIVKTEAVAIHNGTFVYDNIILQKNTVEQSSRKKKEKLPSDSANNAELERLNQSQKEAKYIEVLTDISLEVPKGSLIGICGPVGSGKSSLLLAALGQLRMTKGQISREGSCAYVSQQAWIINSSLKENILFGEQFDAKRYYQVLTVCSLKEDLNMLPAGDETEIGERGVNLSGGQKQRVALARALYSDRDIYYLDDPLSAVDIHVAVYIFENLVLQALKEKTVIFVTHQVQFLKYCNYIYIMHAGKIAEHGTHDELIQLDKEYASMVNSTLLETMEKDLNLRQNSNKANHFGDNNSKILKVGRKQENGQKSEKMRDGGVLMVQETSEIGSLKSHTYRAYIKAAGGYFVMILVFFALFFNIGSFTFSSWWLAVWINAGGGNVTVPGTNDTIISENLNDNPDFYYYQTIYASCIGVILLTSIVRGIAIAFTTINASTNLHNKVFKKILASPLKFFETTPIGRIQNIFSRDLDEVDNYLPITLENLLQNMFVCAFCILFVCAVVPWFCIPLIALGGMFIFISKIFRAVIRDFRRFESITRSPVYSFVTTTVHGLNTIHAFKKEKIFLRKFEELYDSNTSWFYLCQAAMRWSAIRLDCLAIISTSITGFLVVLLKGQIAPALAGLALTYCAQMTGVFQFTVRVMVESEVRFISVERMSYYLRTLENEDKSDKSLVTVQEDWPASGKIEFKKVQMRYRPELPLILFDVSFVVKSGEKIGIVGRTGSGKSSLVVALYRLVEISNGAIKIDGVDISKVKLASLRSKLSIIPQDPVLFSGSIRSNLDPFKKHSDSDIWDALEKTQLKERVKIMTGQLEASVGFGGNNLSVGERQLLCLTRALLRHSKILILDEATSAVDPETEAAVQNTIQNIFAKCTVLTIAHRLKTVVTCDRIFVMRDGHLIESGAPNVLLSDPETNFSKMMAVIEK